VELVLFGRIFKKAASRGFFDFSYVEKLTKKIKKEIMKNNFSNVSYKNKSIFLNEKNIKKGLFKIFDSSIEDSFACAKTLSRLNGVERMMTCNDCFDACLSLHLVNYINTHTTRNSFCSIGSCVGCFGASSLLSLGVICICAKSFVEAMIFVVVSIIFVTMPASVIAGIAVCGITSFTSLFAFIKRVMRNDIKKIEKDTHEKVRKIIFDKLIGLKYRLRMKKQKQEQLKQQQEDLKLEQLFIQGVCSGIIHYNFRRLDETGREPEQDSSSDFELYQDVQEATEEVIEIIEPNNPDIQMLHEGALSDSDDMV